MTRRSTANIGEAVPADSPEEPWVTIPTPRLFPDDAVAAGNDADCQAYDTHLSRAAAFFDA